ncbi:MAG TPA: hypothetical protein VGE74_30925, partial [Gemmata sp.]
DVYRDSEDKAETEREKRARAFFEKQNGGPAPEKPSYISQLKTDEQKNFFAKYVVAPNGGKSVAESAANSQANRLGDLGRAGIASGAVEDAAYEAVAQLAVAPPKGFDPTHKSAEGFVVRHIQHAVRSRIGQEYGSGGKRFGGYVPTDADGNVIEVAGREQDPSAPIDHNAILASTKAREAERARQLEQVRAVLPANALSRERDDRVAALRSLGANYKDASFGAADVRYADVLAGHLGKAIGVTPPGTPPNDGNFVGAAPGGGSGSVRPRDGIHTVPLAQLEEFTKSLGLGRADEVAVRSQILAAANQTNKAGHLTAGLSDAALEVKNGRFARVAGVVNNASVFNPQAAQVQKFVREGEQALTPAEPAPKRSSLTSAEELYQARQLVEARKKFGDTFGVAGDELAENRRRARAQAIGDSDAYEFEKRRRENRRAEEPGYATTLAQRGVYPSNRRLGQRNIGAPEDPLLLARRTRRERASAAQEQQERSARVLGSLSAQREAEENAVRAEKLDKDLTIKGLRRENRDQFSPTGPAAEQAEFARQQATREGRRAAQRQVGGADQLEVKAALLAAVRDPDQLEQFKANPALAQRALQQARGRLSASQFAS